MENIVAHIAGSGHSQRLSSTTNTVYRVWSDSGVSILKIYDTGTGYRREQRALDTLGSIDGLPAVLDRGSRADSHWAQFEDGGTWNLESMPESPAAARRAGHILRRLHDAPAAPLTNLTGGMDAGWITADYEATFERLRRYRRRYNLEGSIIESALAAPRPIASHPTASHGKPYPRKFLIGDDGHATLIDWAWATLAPPEWDFSLAVWMTTLDVGVGAAEAMIEGYGRMMSDDAMRSWIAYHAGMFMLRQAEVRDGPLSDLAYVVDQLVLMV